MATIPIYQMTFGQNKNGDLGLVFPSEQKDYTHQSILFTIPLTERFLYPFELVEFLNFQTIYFPFLLGDEYYNLIAKVNFPELVFEVPRKDVRITFEIDDSLLSWPSFVYSLNSFRRTKYVGNEGQLILKNNGFLNLIPIDLYEMDELYNNHKGAFVGLTSSFGIFESQNNKG